MKKIFMAIALCLIAVLNFNANAFNTTPRSANAKVLIDNTAKMFNYMVNQFCVGSDGVYFFRMSSTNDYEDKYILIILGNKSEAVSNLKELQNVFSSARENDIIDIDEVTSLSWHTYCGACNEPVINKKYCGKYIMYVENKYTAGHGVLGLDNINEALNIINE